MNIGGNYLEAKEDRVGQGVGDRNVSRRHLLHTTHNPAGAAYPLSQFNRAVPLRHPLHHRLLPVLRADEKTEIDQLLVGKPRLLRQSFEIVHNFRTRMDSHGLFVAHVGVPDPFHL